jgi:subtilisin family serine protease
MTSGGPFRSDISAQVSAAGGELQSNFSEIGVATAVSDDPGFAVRARRISGVFSVDADRVVQWVKPEPVSEEINVESVDQQPVDGVDHVFGADETFWNFQWNVRALNAPDAWAAGQIGTGARVAVIDGGMSKNHIDLVGRIDEAHSASFVPGLTWDQDAGTASTFRHATHVAGIIAANDNGIGTIGIAPGATIIAVKALQNGSGTFGWIINALEYASAPMSAGGAGANIVNMSLGATFSRDPRDGSSHLMAALNRATAHARERGVLVIASTGNDTINLDLAPHVVSVPAQSAGVVAIAATGPHGFALGATDFARPAIYSNIGSSFVSFAAPGGADDLPSNAACTIARIPSGSITTACWVFDMVLSPGSGTGGYTFADGTSMAAPAAAGVAALIWGKYGPMSPAQLEARLRASATDLGKPGQDDYYGAGFLNAAAAVK